MNAEDWAMPEDAPETIHSGQRPDTDPQRGTDAGRLEAYPSHKSTDVDWIGMIPAHWEMVRGRYLYTVDPKARETAGIDPTTTVSFVPMEAVGERGELRLDKTAELRSVRGGYTYFRNRDVIVAKITPCFENGKGALADGLCSEIAFGSTEFFVLRPCKGLDAKFLLYITQSRNFRDRGEAEMVGAAGQKRVPPEFVSEFPVPTPGLDEQRAIAAFLDRETAKIDALIEKKQRLAARLQDKRYCELTDLVLGLRRKDAEPTEGFWSASVPTEWQTVPNRYLFKEYDERGFEDLPILNVSIARGVERRIFSDDKVEQRSDDLTVYKRALKGDIVFNKMRMWQGAVGVAPMDGLVSPDYVVARPVVDVESEYFARLFRTDAYKAEVIRHSYGIVWDRNRLYWDGFASIKSLVPPYSEQNRIVEAARELEERFSRLASSIDDQNDHLREYRTALISAAVTGQIDVRRRV